jgi:hypothetical protein
LEAEAGISRQDPDTTGEYTNAHTKQDVNSGGPQSEDDKPDKRTRIFTSTEFQRGVHIDRPSEILGLSSNQEAKPSVTSLSQTTLGLNGVDEGFLQRLMDRHPNGAVWYFDDLSVVVRNDKVQEQDLPEETDTLQRAFPNLRQLLFQPLTDPTSRKRLAGCFLWRYDTRNLFSDVVDLPALRGFLHIVESEIARFDASAAVKQQESFVSSVSHELSTFTLRVLYCPFLI